MKTIDNYHGARVWWERKGKGITYGYTFEGVTRDGNTCWIGHMARNIRNNIIPVIIEKRLNEGGTLKVDDISKIVSTINFKSSADIVVNYKNGDIQTKTLAQYNLNNHKLEDLIWDIINNHKINRIIIP